MIWYSLVFKNTVLWTSICLFLFLNTWHFFCYLVLLSVSLSGNCITWTPVCMSASLVTVCTQCLSSHLCQTVYIGFINQLLSVSDWAPAQRAAGQVHGDAGDWPRRWEHCRQPRGQVNKKHRRSNLSVIFAPWLSQFWIHFSSVSVGTYFKYYWFIYFYLLKLRCIMFVQIIICNWTGVEDSNLNQLTGDYD